MAGGAVGDGEWSGSIRMLGAASDIVWGVMDVEVRTDFPDLLSKVSLKLPPFFLELALMSLLFV